MADSYDGSLRFNTELDNSGFEQGSDKLLQAIKSLQQSVENIGQNMSAGLNSVTQSLQNLSNNAVSANQAVSQSGQEAVTTNQQIAQSANAAAEATQRMSTAPRNVNTEYSSIERTIREIKEAQAEKERTKEIRQELKKTKEEIAETAKKMAEPKKSKPETDATLKVGDTVCIDEMEIVGEILAISDTDTTVLFDTVKLRTTPDKLRKVSRAESRKIVRKWQSGLADELSEKAQHFDLTLDVRGKRAEEALDIVAKYLDEAKLLSIKEVSILHGKGNGILRKLIREYLSRDHDVECFNDASLETGGAGITRVKLH